MVLLIGVLASAGCQGDVPVSRELGAQCETNAECASRCLPSPDWPSGFCTRDCASDADCAVDAICVDTDDGDVCLFACNESRDCEFLGGEEPALWQCRDFGMTEARLACAGAM
jgi:hypothetical protein